jgi:ABC-type multidrug transport system fused ATPase/permease subunit
LTPSETLIPKPTVRQELRTYFFRVGWLALDCWRNFKLRVIFVVALNWIGITAATTVFGGLIFYIRSLESNRTPTFLGIEWQIHTPSMLGLFTAGMLLLGLFSAATLYWADWLIAHVAIAYQKHCTYRLFQIASDPTYQGWQRLVEGPPSDAMQGFFGCTRGTAIALRKILGGTLPGITFLVATGVLIHTSPVLTALLTPLILIYLVPLYQSHQWAVSKQTEYSKISRKVRKGVSRALDFAVGTAAPSAQKLDVAQQSIETPDYDTAGVLFYARKLVNSRFKLVNTIFFLGCLVGLFAFFAIATNTGSRRWSDLLVYLFALRFAFGGLQQVTTVFGKLSRLLPIYSPYVDFVTKAEHYRQERRRSPLLHQALPDTITLTPRKPAFPNTRATLDLKLGDQVWAIVPTEPDFSLMQAIAARLEMVITPEADLISKSAFLTEAMLEWDTSTLPLSRQDLERHWQHPDAAPLRDYFTQAQRVHEVFPESGSSEIPSPTAQAQTSSPEASFLVQVWSAIQAHQVVWISITLLFKLDSDFATAFLNALPNQYVFLVTEDPAKALKRGVLKQSRKTSAGVLVFGNQGVAVCADMAWLKANVEPVQAYLNSQKEEAKTFYAALEDDEDLDDDD